MLACTQLLDILLLLSNSNLPSLRCSINTGTAFPSQPYPDESVYHVCRSRPHCWKGRSPDDCVENVASMTYCSPVSDMSPTGSQQFPGNYELCGSQEIPHQRFKILQDSLLIFFKGVVKVNVHE